MKVFFDTNVYVAEAILGRAAEKMIEATQQASWRIFCGDAVLNEVEKVLTQKLGFSRRFALLTQSRVLRRARCVASGAIVHAVPEDPSDSRFFPPLWLPAWITSSPTTRTCWH